MFKLCKSVLKISELSYSFADRPLFKQLSFTLTPKEGLYLRGKNGSGKTTLMRLIAGLLPYNQADTTHPGITPGITWNSKPIGSAADYQGQLFYLGHKPGCFTQLSLKENLLWHYRLMLGQCVHKDTAYQKINQALHFAGLQQQSDTNFHCVSAGQQQRLDLARLWLSYTDNLHAIWLLDEPLANVDEDAKALYLDLCQIFIEQQGILLIASHQDQQKINLNYHIDLSD